jgi:hypothetical protein
MRFLEKYGGHCAGVVGESFHFIILLELRMNLDGLYWRIIIFIGC